jgi:nicotinamidase-related amidase
MEVPGLESSQLGVLVIDVQPAFWDYAFPKNTQGRQPIMQRLEHLFLLADWMELPTIATFEDPVAHNGEFPESLVKVFPACGQRFTKKTYNATLEPIIVQAIKRCHVTQWAVAGAETEVCVLQSVLGLLRMGYQVFLLEDCLFTSELHPGSSLKRMYQAGAIPITLKAMFYELMVSTERTPWCPEGWIEGGRSYTKPFPEEFIPPEKWLPWEPKA